jgi:hypothetical protein
MRHVLFIHKSKIYCKCLKTNKILTCKDDLIQWKNVKWDHKKYIWWFLHSTNHLMIFSVPTHDHAKHVFNSNRWGCSSFMFTGQFCHLQGTDYNETSLQWNQLPKIPHNLKYVIFPSFNSFDAVTSKYGYFVMQSYNTALWLPSAEQIKIE